MKRILTPLEIETLLQALEKMEGDQASGEASERGPTKWARVLPLWGRQAGGQLWGWLTSLDKITWRKV